VTSRIEKIVSIKGDVDLNQRKGKVLTLYDLDMKLGWEGKRDSQNGTVCTESVCNNCVFR
jgi:activator of HSP90 ATPase